VKEVVFIGAGTRGAKLVGSEYQPYMVFHGKTSLEYVVEAAMGARSIGDIYIWGDSSTIGRILAEHVKRYDHRLVIVEERDNIMESFFYTYLDYLSNDSNTLKSMFSCWDSIQQVNWDQLREYFSQREEWERQVNIIVSDTPLISSDELDFLVENKNPMADVIVGRTRRKDYKAILERLGEIPDREKTIKNFYTYHMGEQDISMIVNSFMAGKPLKLNGNIWNLAGNFYANRTIIAGRKKNIRTIARNLLFFKRLFFPGDTAMQHYSYTDRAKAVFYLINAYKAVIKSKSDNAYYRDLEKIYASIQTLVHLKLEVHLSPCFGAAFDIDTPYEADFVRRNFFALQNICSNYYETHCARQQQKG